MKQLIENEYDSHTPMYFQQEIHQQVLQHIETTKAIRNRKKENFLLGFCLILCTLTVFLVHKYNITIDISGLSKTISYIATAFLTLVILIIGLIDEHFERSKKVLLLK